MCTGTIWSPYALMVRRNSSSTGAQYCDWHRAGVANSAATGFPAPMTVESDCVWSGHIGSRVQMGFTPSVSVVVGDAALGAVAPTIRVVGCAFTWRVKGIFWPWVRASAFHTPGLSKVGNT